MTVRELIALLKQHSLDNEVVVHSYEQGYDPVTDLREIAIQKVENKDWYVGVYDDAPEGGQKVVLIHSRYLKEEAQK